MTPTTTTAPPTTAAPPLRLNLEAVAKLRAALRDPEIREEIRGLVRSFEAMVARREVADGRAQ